MRYKNGTILFDSMGYAIGVVWQTDDGKWRGKKFPQFTSPLCPTNLLSTEAEAIQWVAE